MYHMVQMDERLLVSMAFQNCFDHGCWLLVGCFGLNGPLRQYISPYRAISQREGERGEKRIDESKNVQTTPTHTYYKCSRPLSYCNPNCRTPLALEVYPAPSHHPTTPLNHGRLIMKAKTTCKQVWNPPLEILGCFLSRLRSRSETYVLLFRRLRRRKLFCV